MNEIVLSFVGLFLNYVALRSQVNNQLWLADSGRKSQGRDRENFLERKWALCERHEQFPHEKTSRPISYVWPHHFPSPSTASGALVACPKSHLPLNCHGMTSLLPQSHLIKLSHHHFSSLHLQLLRRIHPSCAALIRVNHGLGSRSSVSLYRSTAFICNTIFFEASNPIYHCQNNLSTALSHLLKIQLSQTFHCNLIKRLWRGR